MSDYTITDFFECLYRSELDVRVIDHIIQTWGITDDDEGWLGGFLIALRDDRIAYMTGTCTSIGWT